MKRTIMVVAGLMLLLFVGPLPPADATGGGACTVTGTINFSASSLTATEGLWDIGPAVISCHGLFNGYERILGPGSFTGSGAYTAFPSGSGTCLHNVGTGTIDYHFPTTQSDIHLVEPGTYTLAGAGAFSTPSLMGTFQVAPSSGDCVTASVTSARFVAQAVLVRFVPPDPTGTSRRDVEVTGGEERDGVPLTNLDQPLFDGAGASKRDLVDYLDAVSGRILPVLRDRPLSVIRMHRGGAPFMQKNVPKYTPAWVETVTLWAETSQRQVSYALCNDRPTLLWFANQRAVEYHPTLSRVDHPDRSTHLVLDLDPPEDGGFPLAVQAAHVIRQALADAGLEGAVKTSGAKGVHVFVPLDASITTEEAALATRAITARAERLDPALTTTAFIKEDRGGKVFLDSTRSGGATVVAAYSPRVRPGAPVSFPVAWGDLDRVAPADFTVRNAAALLADGDPWAALMPDPQVLDPGLVDEGRSIPGGRAQAMHEGKRRARARRDAGS